MFALFIQSDKAQAITCALKFILKSTALYSTVTDFAKLRG